MCAQGDADLELPEVPGEELPEVPEQEPGQCFLLLRFCSKYYVHSKQMLKKHFCNVSVREKERAKKKPEREMVAV